MRRLFAALFSLISIIAVAALVVAWLVFDARSPLPDHWNPYRTLVVADPVTPVTKWKLRRTLADPALCLVALKSGSTMEELPPVSTSQNCHVRTHVSVSKAAGIAMGPIETACETALRTAMWMQHSVRPNARQYLETDVRRLRNAGSYNCRKIRTSRGGSDRWSTHATAMAIDITGFDLADGRSLRLIRHWDDPRTKRFFQAVRDDACDWFGIVLGPDYNALHKDHFHLQSRGWGICR